MEYFGAGRTPGVGCYFDGPYVPFLHGNILCLSESTNHIYMQDVSFDNVCVMFWVLRILYAYTADCINNTFLTLRMYDSQNGDQMFSDFFSTGKKVKQVLTIQ